MTEPGADPVDDFSRLSAFDQADQLCDQFERDLALGKNPRVDDYLDRCQPSERDRVRRELELLVTDYQQGTTSRENPSANARDNDEAEGGPEEVPARIGRFRIEQQLGEGGFGCVYLARDEQLGRRVAIKVPHTDTSPATVQRMLREAGAAAALDHDAIVPVYDIGDDERVGCYVVSSYVEGGTLAERPPHDRQASVELVAALADALQHAHENGIVHRDVKPANILVNNEGRVFLTDFGLALRDKDFGRGARLAGTPAYMSPEQASSHGHRADGRSDVFSLGVVLYELLAGQRPFRGEDRQEVLEQIVDLEPRPLRQLDAHFPAELEAICLKAIAKSPADRYATAGDFAKALRGYLDSTKGATGRRLGWPQAVAVVAIAVAMVAVILAVAVSPRDEPDSSHEATPIAEGPPLRDVVLRVTGPEVESLPPLTADIAVFYPLGRNGEPQVDEAIRAGGTDPIQLQLSPGDYLIVVVVDGHGFHDVYRRVPEENETPGAHRHRRWTNGPDGSVELTFIELQPANRATAGMAQFQGAADFQMGHWDLGHTAPPHRRHVPSFWLDATEVTIADYLATMKVLPTALRREIREQGLQVEDVGSYPITFVNYDDALAYAERVGRRLPYEAEYEFAATAGGRREFPWENRVAEWRWKRQPVGEAAYDRLTTSDPPVLGLFSNAAEWTSSWGVGYPVGTLRLPLSAEASSLRVVRGAPASWLDGGEPTAADSERGPRQRVVVDQKRWQRNVGFRCARSSAPRLTAGDFVHVVGGGAPAPRRDSQ